MAYGEASSSTEQPSIDSNIGLQPLDESDAEDVDDAVGDGAGVAKETRVSDMYRYYSCGSCRSQSI